MSRRLLAEAQSGDYERSACESRITLPPTPRGFGGQVAPSRLRKTVVPNYTVQIVGYRRNFVPGGTFFFTATLRDRRSLALVEHIDALRDSIRQARSERPFHIDAIVVLPDHLHTIWTLPDGDSNYPARWRRIKSAFTHRLVSSGVALKCDRRGEYDLWQRRFWEHTVRDDADFQRCIDYIHFNPVKHGLVARVSDWEHSSFRRFVRAGLLSMDWGGHAGPLTGGFGERDE